MDSVQRNVKSLEGFGQTFNNLHQNQQFLSGKKKNLQKLIGTVIPCEHHTYSP